MTLKQCTKDELLYIVERFVNKAYIDAILLDIEMKRLVKQHNEVRHLTEEAKKTEEKVKRLLEPYGESMNTPPEVMREANKLARYADECVMKAAKILSIKPKAVSK